MYKRFFGKLKLVLGFLTTFLFFWFLNSGFLVEPLWLPFQALFFTIVCFLILKTKKPELAHWFIFVGFLYATSVVLEIFSLLAFSEIAASSGFGVLVILIISRMLVRSD